MRFRLALVLALLVILPLALLAWLGARVAEAERIRLTRTFDDLLRSKLGETDSLCSRLLEERGRRLLQLLEDGDLSPVQLDRLSRTEPTVVQAFHQASDGAVLFPSPEEGLTQDQRSFLERFRPVFDGKMLLVPAEAVQRPPSPSTSAFSSLYKSSRSVISKPAAAPSFGWLPWHWGTGLRLLFWVRRPDGSIGGAELSPARLLADLIGSIPETGSGDPLMQQGAVTLIDSGGRTLYRWGGFQPPPGEKARLQVSLGGPLHGWALTFHASPALQEGALGPGTQVPLLTGLLAVGLALTGLAILLYRENVRELREAAQRVSFVNQVSHELKTPLTNIRLHAELLAGDLDEEDESHRQRVGVIVSESQRLGRLINNVLTFSRQQRDRIALRPEPAIPDQLVGAILERFRPFLEGRGIRLEISFQAGTEVRLDADALEQILNNLLSNVDKYAAAGRAVFIATRQATGTTFLVVRDAGPGIPETQAEFVFQPFARLNDSLTEGVAGAGIGLTLARELARRHGGDLELVYRADRLCDLPDAGPLFAPAGACFLARLQTPSTKEPS